MRHVVLAAAVFMLVVFAAYAPLFSLLALRAALGLAFVLREENRQHASKWQSRQQVQPGATSPNHGKRASQAIEAIGVHGRTDFAG